MRNFRRRQNRPGRVFADNKKCRRTGQANGANAVITAVAEKSDGTRMIDLVGVRVQRRVKLRTRDEQAQHPDR